MRISNIRVPHLGQDGATMTFGGNWMCAAIFSSRVTEAEHPPFPSLHLDSDYCHRMTLCAAFTGIICGKIWQLRAGRRHSSCCIAGKLAGNGSTTVTDPVGDE